MDYVIFTDTSANLPDKVVREYGLRLIPFFYCPPEHPEGIPCPGSEEFDGSAYYNAIRGGAVVTTSQINVHQYVNAMDPVLEAGHDILFVGMSSGISGAYHSATQAAHILSEQYPERRIRTVDTLSASLGEGLLVIEAAKMRVDCGFSTAEQETAQMTGGSYAANMRLRKGEAAMKKEVDDIAGTQTQNPAAQRAVGGSSENR